VLDVHDVLDGTLLLLRKQLEHGRVNLSRKFCSGPLLVSGVADELAQVFLNICLNAIYAMPEGGELTVETRREPVQRDATIRFADSGVGIAEDHIDQLFEPFHSTRSDGTGLGLAISYDIVAKHGGCISVDSQVGAGSTFSVRLPGPSEGAGITTDSEGPLFRKASEPSP
jgi:two-component system NtrC family sensor kinase